MLGGRFLRYSKKKAMHYGLGSVFERPFSSQGNEEPLKIFSKKEEVLQMLSKKEKLLKMFSIGRQ